MEKSARKFVIRNIGVILTGKMEASMAGQYASDGEVIRDALREKELRTAELDMLRAKLIASEQSGISDRTPQDIRNAAKDRLKRNEQT